jgi:hypothetical protein
MTRHIAGAIINSGLMAVVLTLLGAPLYLGYRLGTPISATTLGAVDTRSIVNPSPVPAQSFAVYPNASDFSAYAQFGPPIKKGDVSYASDVTFTAFAGQQATYDGIFTVYNTGTQPLRLVVEGGTLQGDLSKSRVWITLSDDIHNPISLLTRSVTAVDTKLSVADPAALKGDTIVVGTRPLKVLKVQDTTLELANPVGFKAAIGDKVVLGPAFYLNAPIPVVPQTHVLTVAPQSRALVSLLVATDTGSSITGKAVLPIHIHVE